MNHNFFKKIDRLFFPIFLSLSFLFSFLSSSLIFSFLFLPLSSLHPVASLRLPSFSTVSSFFLHREALLNLFLLRVLGRGGTARHRREEEVVLGRGDVQARQ
jgi:hypothetical protein